MPAYMRRNIRHLYPIDIVVPLHHVVGRWGDRCAGVRLDPAGAGHVHIGRAGDEKPGVSGMVGDGGGAAAVPAHSHRVPAQRAGRR